MQIPEEDYKIRMVITPSFEGESRYIVMDKLKPFDEHTTCYTLGCCLYSGKSRADGKTIRDSEIPFSQLCMRHRQKSTITRTEIRLDGPICRTKEDMFEIPTLEEYNKFMTLLRMNGFSYNRKKGELKKDGRVF